MRKGTALLHGGPGLHVGEGQGALLEGHQIAGRLDPQAAMFATGTAPARVGGASRPALPPPLRRKGPRIWARGREGTGAGARRRRKQLLQGRRVPGKKMAPERVVRKRRKKGGQSNKGAAGPGPWRASFIASCPSAAIRGAEKPEGASPALCLGPFCTPPPSQPALLLRQ